MFTVGPALFGGRATDANIALVALLLHGDGADDSTTFTDSSTYARTVTGAGSAKIGTEQSVFGGACLDFTAAGNEARVEIAGSSTLRITGDFAIEFRARFTSVAAGIYFMLSDDATQDIYFFTSSSGKVGYYCLGNARNDKATVSANTWYDFKLRRSGSTITFEQDGSQVDTFNSSADQTGSPSWKIGAMPSFAGSNTGGRCWIDELRLTIGNARSSAVATEAFPDP